MKTETFKGTVESAYGKVLNKAVSFSGTFEELERVEEIPDNEKLGPADILDVVNNKRKAKARAQATTEALTAAGIEKPDQNDPAVIKENVIKLTMKQYNVTREVAEKIQEMASQAVMAAK